MKKIMKLISGFVAAVFIIIAVIWGSFVYRSDYKITEADTSVSPDGTYELVLQAVGEADFPFGPASGQLILKEGKNEIVKAEFELFDDGRNIRSSIWEVSWHEDCAKVILSGEEQIDEQIILYFDGRKEVKQLTDWDRYGEAWAWDIGESEEINSQTASDPQTTSAGESQDDEKSKGRKAKLFFSASIRDAVFLLLDSPDKFIVDSNALFLTLAAASHTRRFVNRNPVNQFVKHEAVEFFKAGVFSDKGCEAVNIGFGIPNLFQRLFHLCNVRFQRCPFRIVVCDKHGKDMVGQLAAHVVLIGAFQLHVQIGQPILCRCNVTLHCCGLFLLVGAFQFHEPLCGFFSVLAEQFRVAADVLKHCLVKGVTVDVVAGAG